MVFFTGFFFFLAAAFASAFPFAVYGKCLLPTLGITIVLLHSDAEVRVLPAPVSVGRCPILHSVSVVAEPSYLGSLLPKVYAAHHAVHRELGRELLVLHSEEDHLVERLGL